MGEPCLWNWMALLRRSIAAVSFSPVIVCIDLSAAVPDPESSSICLPAAAVDSDSDSESDSDLLAPGGAARRTPGCGRALIPHPRRSSLPWPGPLRGPAGILEVRPGLPKGKFVAAVCPARMPR